eukprot:jgi/Psemu1/10927/gm1.10927_g
MNLKDLTMPQPLNSVSSYKSFQIGAVDLLPRDSLQSSIPIDVYCDMESLEVTTPVLESHLETNGDPNFDRDNPIPDVINHVKNLIPSDPIAAAAYFQQGVKAHIDTGAKVSCTNLKHILHGYKPYTKLRKCLVRLTAAIGGKAATCIPEGSGYLHIPVPNHIGYLKVFFYYSPSLSTTLLSENDLCGMTSRMRHQFSGESIHKAFTDTHDSSGQQNGNLTIICHHKQSTAKSIVLHGSIIDGQCFMHPVLIPDVDFASPYANCATSSAYALATDMEFKKACELASKEAISNYRYDTYTSNLVTLQQCTEAARAQSDTTNTPKFDAKLFFTKLVDKNIPIQAIKAKTSKLLWHQRLGHPCDDFLYNAHKHILGVPKFQRQTSILDQCPTCIQCKQTKCPAGSRSTRKATQPFQGLSINFAFSGARSSNSKQKRDYKGIHGETAWILITDHYTGMKYGDTRISKAAPLHWLEHFFSQHNPACANKYVSVDQGGKLYYNPDIRNLFSAFGYSIFPTANSMRSMLSGANLPIKFWPFAFYHALRLSNAFPEGNQHHSPLELATGHKENLATTLRPATLSDVPNFQYLKHVEFDTDSLSTISSPSTLSLPTSGSASPFYALLFLLLLHIRNPPLLLIASLPPTPVSPPYCPLPPLRSGASLNHTLSPFLPRNLFPEISSSAHPTAPPSHHLSPLPSPPSLDPPLLRLNHPTPRRATFVVAATASILLFSLQRPLHYTDRSLLPPSTPPPAQHRPAPLLLLTAPSHCFIESIAPLPAIVQPPHCSLDWLHSNFGLPGSTRSMPPPTSPPASTAGRASASSPKKRLQASPSLSSSSARGSRYPKRAHLKKSSTPTPAPTRATPSPSSLRPRKDASLSACSSSSASQSSVTSISVSSSDSSVASSTQSATKPAPHQDSKKPALKSPPLQPPALKQLVLTPSARLPQPAPFAPLPAPVPALKQSLLQQSPSLTPSPGLDRQALRKQALAAANQAHSASFLWRFYGDGRFPTPSSIQHLRKSPAQTRVWNASPSPTHFFSKKDGRDKKSIHDWNSPHGVDSTWSWSWDLSWRIWDGARYMVATC